MSTEPLPLRAHNVLCLQGFRGEGYSDLFVARMREVHAGLREDPSRPVRLLAEPDVLCDACPNLERGTGCALQGPEHEAHMRAQDEDVLRRLDLEPGVVVPWVVVLARIAASIRGADLPDVCTTCPWLSLGWCAEGIDALRDEPASPLP